MRPVRVWAGRCRGCGGQPVRLLPASVPPKRPPPVVDVGPPAVGEDDGDGVALPPPVSVPPASVPPDELPPDEPGVVVALELGVGVGLPPPPPVCWTLQVAARLRVKTTPSAVRDRVT